jgi:Lrp/AsnC family transcriptional regulator, leucine-responsive regulatory protein
MADMRVAGAALPKFTRSDGGCHPAAAGIGRRTSMDNKDVRIFCEMAFKYLEYSAFAKRHVSPSEIGRRLGLDEKTVRTRVRRMEREGFIKYYQAIPNPSLFGLPAMGFYSFEAVDVPSKHGALERLQKTSGIIETFDMLGPGFLATLAASSPDDLQPLADRTVHGLNLSRSVKVGDRVGRGTSRVPDVLDWGIIASLRYDALRPATEIASDLSITPRMAEYRISKLLQSGALFIRAILDAQRQRGLVFYGLVAAVDEAKKSQIIGTLKDEFGERLWSLYGSMRGVIVANVFAFSSTEPESAAMDVLKLAGVERCSFAIFKEMIEPARPNWIDRLIEEKTRAGESGAAVGPTRQAAP